MFAQFFIHRPVFAMVLSIMIVLAGLISMPSLPIVQYPPITPPVVQVTATYPGANSEVVEETVATPIEQQINGVKGMIYMTSKSANNGVMTLQIFFEVGYDLDIAAVDVQNRVALAEPVLPEEVRRQGINIDKVSPDMLQVIALYSPDQSYDDLFLSNYALINLKDAIARVNGVGDITLVGKGDYGMRIWIDPDKLANMGMTVTDVIGAVQEQNLQAPAGAIGQPPIPAGQEFQYTVRVKGRLTDPEEFSNIIIRANPDGTLVYLRDVARVELAAKNYELFGRFNGQPAALMIVYQSPGANALDVADQINDLLANAKANYPQGIDHAVTYDNTLFVRESIKEVQKTLFEAIFLVVLVTFVFLQGWRATLIPTLAVPVSLIGTFMFFAILGYSINTLTMFALVLAIGLVVDDAIVVVEAVEAYLEQGKSPVEATEQAMKDVSMPIIAIALALYAVFVPVAFMSGITGRLYQQFAVTMIVSVGLSAICSLTLSPALCVLLLRHRRKVGGPLGAFYAGFNKLLDGVTRGYSRTVRMIIRKAIVAFLTIGAAAWLSMSLIRTLPPGFVPDEDVGVILGNVQLPDAASQERTDAIVRGFEEKLMKLEGVKDVSLLGGMSIASGINASNVAALVITLKPWDERKTPETSISGLMGSVAKIFAEDPGAVGFAFTLPAIPGMGNVNGVTFELQDRGGNTIQKLDEVTQNFLAECRKRPEIRSAFTGFNTNTPQIFLDVDREKAKAQGIPLNDLFQTLAAYMGGAYINDFNAFGRTYQVWLQADPAYRRSPQDLGRFHVRSASGTMTPLSTLTSQKPITGPQFIVRYNLYRAAEINVVPAPGYSSGQAMKALEEIAAKLPGGFGYEYSGLAYQEKKSGNQAPIILAFASLLVFLVLAAQYESWTTPLAVLLAIPVGILGALGLEWLRGLENNVYFQIGLVMLIGLAAKNAILIVEFAREKRAHGMSLEDAAVEGSRVRLRPILMTSFAFILGCMPLMLSTGAGANSRQAMGTAVVGGMLLATSIAILIIPTLYVFSQRFSGKKDTARQGHGDAAHGPGAPPATGVEGTAK